MLVSIHQPNYFPWSGYFSKILRSQHFVFLDDVQFSKGSFTNRAQIDVAGDQKWLTIPCKPKLGTSIVDVEIKNYEWIDQHKTRIELGYSRAQKFDEVWPFVRKLLGECDGLKLAEMNIHTITSICLELGINTVLHRSSEVSFSRSNDASKNLAELVRRLGGRRYLSGQGGSTYNRTDVFESYGVEVIYSNFIEMPRVQHSHSFKPGLSILDVLFNLGWNETKKYLFTCGNYK